MVSRRAMLGRVGAAMLGAAATTACSPSFIARALYPEADHLRGDAVDRGLAAFVGTVLPGCEDAAAIARLFADPLLRIAPLRGVLVAELDRRARNRCAQVFERLDLAERTAAIQDGLAAGGISEKVLTGAIYLSQVAYFGGLWNSTSACPTIGFDGPYHYDGPGALTYPDPLTFFAVAITADGNPC